MQADCPPSWTSAGTSPEKLGNRVNQASAAAGESNEGSDQMLPSSTRVSRNSLEWNGKSPILHSCSRIIRRISSGGSISSTEMDAGRATSPDMGAQQSKLTRSPPPGASKRARSAMEANMEDELVRRAHACADLDLDHMRNKRFLSEAMAKDLDRLNMAREDAPSSGADSTGDGNPKQQSQDLRMGRTSQDGSGADRGTSPPLRHPEGVGHAGTGTTSGIGPFESPVAQTNPFWGTPRQRGSNFVVMRRQSSPPTPSTGPSNSGGTMTPSSATPCGPHGRFPIPGAGSFGAASLTAPFATPSSRAPSSAAFLPSFSSIAPCNSAVGPATADGTEPPSTPSHLIAASALHQRILAQHDAMLMPSSRPGQAGAPPAFGAAPPARNPCDTPLPATPIKSKHLLMEKLPVGPSTTSPSDPQMGNHDLRRTAMLRALLQRAEISDGTPAPRGPAGPASATTPPVLSLLGPTPRRASNNVPEGTQGSSSLLLGASPPGFGAPQDRAGTCACSGQSLAMRMDAAAEEEQADGRMRPAQLAPPGSSAIGDGNERGGTGGFGQQMSDSSMELSPTTSGISEPDMDTTGVPGLEGNTATEPSQSRHPLTNFQTGVMPDMPMWGKTG